MKREIHITKASGERELFDEGKLRRSLERAGAAPDAVIRVVKHIEKELEDGMTTDHIYRHAFSVLKDLKSPGAMRSYSLRRALIDLGPTGFPFEKFIAEVLRAKGYEVATDQMMQGRCVAHEVDVVAWNESKLIMVEAKFHNRMGEKSDLKVALYVKARFDDLSESQFGYGKHRPLDEGWLVTNTKFTENAIKYGKCAGLTMIGWNYPEKGSVRDMVEDTKMHPITCLSTLSTAERRLLLENDMVLCRQVINAPTALAQLGLGEAKAEAIAAEAKLLCSV